MPKTKISENQISIQTQALLTSLDFASASGYLNLPSGTTLQRPTVTSSDYGTIRFNITRDVAEIYNTQTGSADWNSIGSETGLDGGNAYIRTNGTTITKNITIGPVANNDQKYTYGLLIGDITIDSGITVTVESGAALLITDMDNENGGDYPEYIREINLFSWLDASRVSSYGTSTWTDLKNGNVYTINGSMQSDPDSGGCFYFDGVNDNVTLAPTSIPQGQQISFCVWNYGIDRVSSSVIEARTAAGNRTLNVHLSWGDGVVYFDTGDDSGSDRISKTATDLEFKKWHFWCFIKNTTTGLLQIYLDGALWTETTGNTKQIGSSSIARLGSYTFNSTYHKGYVGEVHIYDSALTATQVKDNYDITRFRYRSSTLTV